MHGPFLGLCCTGTQSVPPFWLSWIVLLGCTVPRAYFHTHGIIVIGYQAMLRFQVLFIRFVFINPLVKMGCHMDIPNGFKTTLVGLSLFRVVTM